MNKRVVNLFLLVALILGLMVGCGTEPTAVPAEPTAAPAEPTAAPAEPTAEPAAEGGRLILATTTSTQDSGLLDVILPDFEAQAGVPVEVIAVGTGQAIELGEAGDADVLLVHARSREDAFMDAGHGVRREDVMYNDFIIVGPPDDPAGIAGMTDAAAAFAKMAEAEAPFVSRGDDSGTHTKEKAVWSAAGIEPTGDWYISAGQGMGAVLTMADEQQAYTLSDRATYLARTLEGTELVIVVEGDPILFNPYGVLAVNPEKSDKINNELANEFIDWLISMPTQEMIAEFGVAEFGAPLFTPDSALWREAHPVAGGAADAALKITGNVANEIGWTEEEVRAMPTIEAQSTNKDGETSTYTGVLINDLLTLAGPNADATTVVFVADDGYTGEATLAEVQGCADCIVSFREKGGFSIVMPGFSGKVQVKGVVEIQVK
ncbi:MAG: substrate-binding domain-containing protein [Anaerolineae bacterium]|nr:substrate-binding domain-containing protein [Anaerolineae bacterium]